MSHVGKGGGEGGVILVDVPFGAYMVPEIPYSTRPIFATNSTLGIHVTCLVYLPTFTIEISQM